MTQFGVATIDNIGSYNRQFTLPIKYISEDNNKFIYHITILSDLRSLRVNRRLAYSSDVEFAKGLYEELESSKTEYSGVKVKDYIIHEEDTMCVFIKNQSERNESRIKGYFNGYKIHKPRKFGRVSRGSDTEFQIRGTETIIRVSSEGGIWNLELSKNTNNLDYEIMRSPNLGISTHALKIDISSQIDGENPYLEKL